MTVPFVLDGDASGRGWGMGCFLVIDGKLLLVDKEIVGDLQFVRDEKE